MIKTIIFDYGGVLGPDATDWVSMYKQLITITKLSAEKIDKIWMQNKTKLLTGHEDMPQFFEELARESKEKIIGEKLLQIYLHDTYINKKALAFAKELKKKKYKILILSNETKTGMGNKIKKFKLKDIFDEVYCSANIGITKRDPKVFEYVLRKENIEPEETLFIDDRLPNVEVAESLGISSIHFASLEDLKMRMKNFGI